jgi:hypothetical protein
LTRVPLDDAERLPDLAETRSPHVGKFAFVQKRKAWWNFIHRRKGNIDDLIWILGSAESILIRSDSFSISRSSSVIPRKEIEEIRTPRIGKSLSESPGNRLSLSVSCRMSH